MISMNSNFEKYVYQFIVLAAVSMIGIGTVVFHIIEKWSWVNSYYFSVVTLTTVGYGDYVPKTAFGKIFDTFYILIGVGIITTFVTTLVKRRGEKFSDRQSARQDRKKTDNS